MKKKLQILSFLLFTFCFHLKGANIFWVTGAVGDWDDPTMWVGGVLPGLTDNANINSGTATVPDGYTVMCNRITVNGGILNINTNAEISLSQSDTHLRLQSGEINNLGTINISNSGTSGGIDINEGIFTNTNSGTINILNANGAAVYAGAGSFINDGVITVNTTFNYDGYGLRMSGPVDFDNNGTINITSTSSSGIYLQAFTSSGKGTFNNNSTGQINISNTTSAFGNGLHFHPSDTVVFNNEGNLSISNLAPGNVNGIFMVGVTTGVNILNNLNGGVITLDNAGHFSISNYTGNQLFHLYY